MPPARILLQWSTDSLLYIITIYHSQWRNWPGTERRIAPPPGKLNVKNGLYFGFNIPLVFSRLLFLCFFGSFSGDLVLV